MYESSSKNYSALMTMYKDTPKGTVLEISQDILKYTYRPNVDEYTGEVNYGYLNPTIIPMCKKIDSATLTIAGNTRSNIDISTGLTTGTLLGACLIASPNPDGVYGLPSSSNTIRTINMHYYNSYSGSITGHFEALVFYKLT